MQTCLRLALCLAVFVPSHSIAQESKTDRPSGSDDVASLVLTGPPNPAFLRDSLAVADSGLARYTEEYGRHMAHTEAQRARAVAGLKKASRDEEGVRTSSAGDLVRAILREDGSFEDHHLMPLLTPDQRRAFKLPRIKALRTALRDRTRPPAR